MTSLTRLCHKAPSHSLESPNWISKYAYCVSASVQGQLASFIRRSSCSALPEIRRHACDNNMFKHVAKSIFSNCHLIASCSFTCSSSGICSEPYEELCRVCVFEELKLRLKCHETAFEDRQWVFLRIAESFDHLMYKNVLLHVTKGVIGIYC